MNALCFDAEFKMVPFLLRQEAYFDPAVVPSLLCSYIIDTLDIILVWKKKNISHVAAGGDIMIMNVPN